MLLYLVYNIGKFGLDMGVFFMENKHHYFFAIKLPKEAKKFIYQWAQQNEQILPFKRWVHPEDYHITLAFLGYQENERLQKAINEVGAVLADEEQFSLTLNQLGTFGKITDPRIFWMNVMNSSRLTDIQKKVYNQCIQLGFSLDKKPFLPHITLARKWSGPENFRKELLEQCQPRELFTFTVNQIVLYETHIEDTPKYKEFYAYHLNRLTKKKGR